MGQDAFKINQEVTNTETKTKTNELGGLGGRKVDKHGFKTDFQKKR